MLIFIVYFVTGNFIFLFSQKRIGRSQDPFTMYKFRTLSRDTTRSLKDREFGWGRFMRKSSLDELPQLFNVIKGDMSFVGPRPLPFEYLEHIPDKYKSRFDVKPGITGWTQVNRRKDRNWDAKMEMDLEYLERKSFSFDLKILFSTIKVLISPGKQELIEEISLIEYYQSKG